MKSILKIKELFIFIAILIFLIFGFLTIYSQAAGDANDDGAIDIIDALLIAQFYVGMSPSTFYETAADVNADGTANIIDALLVAQFYVGIITEFPGGGNTDPPTPDPTAPPEATDSPVTGECGICVGYGTYPYCCDPETSDPDGDGWGWENEQSCIVTGSQVEYDQNCACPVITCPTEAKCDCYHVSGLDLNKLALTAAGGNVYDMAAAMMETEAMNTDYPFGDGKMYDAACFGVCKQNWGMLRVVNPEWSDLGPEDYETGGALNDNLALDMELLHASQEYFGDLWWAGHRNGSTGLENPDTEDILNFKTVMDWTYEMLMSDPVFQTNDLRFSVDVGAI